MPPTAAGGGNGTYFSDGIASVDGDAHDDASSGLGSPLPVRSRRRLRGPDEEQRGASSSDWQAIPSGGSRLDLDLIDQLVEAIQRRRPGIATLPAVARSVQAELIPDAGADPLRPETVQAVDRVFSELYSDADALAAIEAARPALSPNPREIKRYVNLFRFYTFIVQRQRLEGLAAPSGNCIAKLAAFAIRWPHLLTTFTQVPEASEGNRSVVATLDEAAGAGDDTTWRAALAAAGLLGKDDRGDDVLPEWSASVRSFLADGPRIGDLAGRLL